MLESNLTKEETHEMIQKKCKNILETLKGVTYEQSKAILQIVTDEISERMSKTIL